jgi:hypothetical protein
MRKDVYLRYSLATLIFLCFIQQTFAQKEIFVREMEFKLTEISPNEYENEYFMTLNFNKGTKYKFKILNKIEGLPGEAVVKILDGDKLVGTNSIGDKYFDAFLFQCNKTGFYDILITFKDNQTGHAKVNLFLLQ